VGSKEDILPVDKDMRQIRVPIPGSPRADFDMPRKSCTAGTQAAANRPITVPAQFPSIQKADG
jgi:hypothetical protein